MSDFTSQSKRRCLRASSAKRLALLFILVAGALSGCGGKDGTGPNANPAGTYTLNGVDDYTPPTIIYQGPWVDHVSGAYYSSYVVQVTDAAIELDDEGRYTLAFVGVVNADGQPGPAHFFSGGSYSLDGRDLWLDPDLGAPVSASGTLHRGTLALDFDLMSRGATNHYTFRR